MTHDSSPLYRDGYAVHLPEGSVVYQGVLFRPDAIDLLADDHPVKLGAALQRLYDADERWTPTVPGPQPHNQLAGTAEEQVLRAFEPAPLPPDEPPPRAELQAEVARLTDLVADLAEAVTTIIGRVAALEQQRGAA